MLHASAIESNENIVGLGNLSDSDRFPAVSQIARSDLENGFVYLPEQAEWLAGYLHEMCVFPKGKSDDQVDSTSQALDWICNRKSAAVVWAEYYEDILEREKNSYSRILSVRSLIP